MISQIAQKFSSSIVPAIARRTTILSQSNGWIRSATINIRFESNDSQQPPRYDNETLSKMVKMDKVVVFMKGVPEAPRCGFSNAVVQVLRMHGVPFQAHDVLESDELRKAIKDFTSWPTIPQIFIEGEFIGGCDILLEKHQNGELVEDLQKIGIKSQILKEYEQNKNDSDGNSKK